MAQPGTAGRPSSALRRALVPLALAQFICSFAGSNMNVMINDISKDLDTTVQGVQIAITVFLLVMAALMIPGGKLTDRYGRKRCFTVGLVIYGVGALVSAAAPGLGVLIIGNSILEGVGTALLIPPVYILTTLLFTGVASRARAFGVISAMGGIGAAAGPLIGGLITSAISWRAAFVFQALVIAVIVVLSRRVKDPLPADPTRPFDIGGAVLSAVGLILIVMGILAADNNLWLMLALIVAGALVLVWFFAWVRGQGAGRQGAAAVDEPVPQPHVQPRPRHPEHPVADADGRVVHGRGLPAGRARLRRDPDRGDLHRRHRRPAGVLAGRRAAREAVRAANPDPGRLRRHDRRHRRPAGPGDRLRPQRLGFAPGLLLIGLGLGAMLTPSVNIVQSSFAEDQQGEISGLSRCVSNLGSSLGTAIAGTILVAGITSTPERSYGLAMIALAVVGLIGLAASVFLPAVLAPPAAARPAQEKLPRPLGTT